MPKRSRKQRKTSRDKPRVAPKEPLVDNRTDYWEERILNGSIEKRIEAIKEAGEKRDVKALPALIKSSESNEDIENIIETDYALHKIILANPGKAEVLNLIPMIFDLKDQLQTIILMKFIAKANPDNERVLQTVPELVKKLYNKDDEIIAEYEMIPDLAETLGVIGEANPGNAEIKRAVPELIKICQHHEPDGSDIMAVKALGKIKDRRAIQPLKKLLIREGDFIDTEKLESIDTTIEHARYSLGLPSSSNENHLENLNRRHIRIHNYLEEALENLGLSKEEIKKASEDSLRLITEGQLESKKDAEKYLKSEWQKAAYKIITERKDAKKLLFENAEVLELLPDKQAWITINDPELAKKVLNLALEKLGNKRNSLENVLKAGLGIKSKDIDDDYFKYYADEILDVVAQVVKNSELRDNAELSSLLSKIKYGNGGIKLRYIAREKSDLTLGDKCGDCTATGSIHYGDSMSWLVNPAYQILKMSKGKRFIGKINFTLGTIDNKDAIIIDAIEFNPQAQEGKPYHDDAVECFDAALEFLRDLAKRENRELFALRVSNSGGAVDILHRKGEPIYDVKKYNALCDEEKDEEADKLKKSPVQLTLLVPKGDIKHTLASTGHKGQIQLFYQMVETYGAMSIERVGKDLMDERLPELEREVLNPAQIANPEIATAMRKRDFNGASAMILSDPELDKKVKSILKLPDVSLSPKFLSEKISKIYGEGSTDIDSLKRTYPVGANKFVKL